MSLFVADRDRLRNDLEVLSIVRNQILNPKAIRTVTQYIAQQFQSAGYRVEREAFYSWLTAWRVQHNLIATINGSFGSISKPDSKPVILGAHYDTVPFSPGADDNASGVAILLEIARLSARIRPDINRPIHFIAFGMEEEGCIGSCRHATRLRKKGREITTMISLECVGYTDSNPHSQQIPPGLPIHVPDRGTFLGVIGNELARPHVDLMKTCAASHTPNLEMIPLVVPDNGHQLPATRLSDHAPFWDRGYPAMMLTDTAFLRNVHYHRPSDLPDTLDLDFMSRIAEAVSAFVSALTS